MKAFFHPIFVHLQFCTKAFVISIHQLLSLIKRLLRSEFPEDAMTQSSSGSEEFVEVTLDFNKDETIIRSVIEPVAKTPRPLKSKKLRQCSSWNSGMGGKGLSDSLSDQFHSEVDLGLAARDRRRQMGQMDRSRSGAERAIKGLRFISSNDDNGKMSWGEVENNFENLAKDGYLCRTDFPLCIGMEDSKEFAMELFDVLNRRRRLKLEKISKVELYEYWSQIGDQSFDSRLQLFFDMVDKNGDGRLTEQEIKEIIILSASACKLSRIRDQADEYAAFIMEELDPDKLGYIELWQLETLLLQKDSYTSYSMALSYTEHVLSTNLHELRYRSSMQRMRMNMLYFLKYNWNRIWVLSLWILIMVALFIWKFIEYRRNAAFYVMGYCLTTAKGAAETLKFNMALILLLACRNTITWLRTTRLAYIIPFDDNINFHKVVGGAIVLGTLLHAGLHLACDFVRLEKSSPTEFMIYLSDFSVHGHKPTYGDLILGWEGVTGIIMVVLLGVTFTLATRKFRRGVVKLPKPFDRFTGFNAFWYSHHLLIIVYICLFIHGIKLYLVHKWYKKTTWMYLVVPMLLYAGERTLRLFRSSLYNVRLLKVAIYPGNVLALQMSKPPQFSYKSGQYMFVQCPAISLFEWHPFSITSSPGDDYLSIHVLEIGDWTEQLHKIFKQGSDATAKSMPKLLIDGPYAAPAQDYRNYDVLLFAGLGIGVAPFISILKDLINNIIKEEEEEEEMASDLNMDLRKQKKTLRTKKAYFYWLTNEQGSFDWFRGVMNEVAELDKRGVVEMHNYLTSVYDQGDARSALITMLATLNHAKNGIDIVSGTKVRTHFAKPNWKKVLSNIGSKHVNERIGVFCCGEPILAKELKFLCNEYNNKRGETKFDFHKEHF